MRGLIKGAVVLGMAAAVLPGCGGGGNTVKTTYYRYKAIDYLQATGATFTQTGRLGFSYLSSGKLDRVTHYHLAGVDGKWGTDDDKSDYSVTCSFSSADGPATSLDLKGELTEGLRALYLAAPAGIAGIPQADVAGACEREYSGQAGLTEKVFTSGADGKPGTGDDVEQFRMVWTSASANNSHLVVSGSGFPADSSDFYYRKSTNGVYRYIVTQGMYRRYTFNTGTQGLTALDRKTTTVSAPSDWVMELGTDTQLDSVVYTGVSVNSTYRDHYDSAGQPVSRDLVIISNNLPAGVFHLGAGADLKPCTADDENAIVSKELYVLEQAG